MLVTNVNKEKLPPFDQRQITFIVYIIHLLHAGEGNLKIYSPKSIIFPEGNARGEYDTRE